jgi:hypothetical protein
MHTCTECGNEYPADFAFCTGCGQSNTSLESQDAVEQSESQIGSIGILDDLTPLEINIGEYREPEVSLPKSTQSEPLITVHSDEEVLLSSQERLDLLTTERNRLEDDLRERRDFLESLEKWERKNSSSFLFKVFKKMQFNLNEASSLLTRYATIIGSLVIPSPGVMQSLRKKFHKTLLWSFTVVPAIALFFIYLPAIMERMSGAPGLESLIEKFYFAKTTIILWALFALFLLTWNALISYYKGWSRFQALVNRTLFDLHNVAEGAEQVRGEELRLKSLYPQVKEWLEILGRSLNHPWIVRPEWYEASNGSITRDSLPNAMRIGQVVEDESPSMLAMQRFAAESFMAKGWRARVFAEQIDVIRENKGLPKERLNVEQLDQDISYSPNGPRAIVASLISDERILEIVARKQIQPLAIEIQRETSGNTRPDIRELMAEKTQTVLGATQDSSGLRPWDDFLSLSIGSEGRASVPLSLASLSSEGQRANHHSSAKSYFLLPARLGSQLSIPSEQVRTYSEADRMPMDITVRLDLVGPVQSQDLSILEGAERERMAKQSEIEKDIEKKLKARKSGI